MVSVNVPPFLEHGRFTESEAKVTKSIARCCIHVERANARLKDFNIFKFCPSLFKELCRHCVSVECSHCQLAVSVD